MKWSEASIRASEISHFRKLIRQSRSFDHLDELLVGRLNETLDVNKQTSTDVASEELKQIVEEAALEYAAAEATKGKFNSFHQGISVIREEFEELWDEVKKRSVNRDKDAMRREAVQIIAATMHFIKDLLEVKR